MIDGNKNFILHILINLVIGLYSFKSKKLTLNGSVVAFLLGFITMQADLGLFIILLAFFLSSSFLTRVGDSKKEKFLTTHKKEKIRSVKQVLSNGLLPGIAALIILILKSIKNYKKNHISSFMPCIFENDLTFSVLYIFYVSYIACCNGDTWASEIGVLSKNNPILITSRKVVPKGTNGGISFLGTIMACLGGIFIGSICGCLQYFYCNPSGIWKIFYIPLIIGVFSGLVGSSIDSLLGACLQLSVYDKNSRKIVCKNYEKFNNEKNYIIIGRDVLSNDIVNLLSALITASMSVGIFIILNRTIPN